MAERRRSIGEILVGFGRISESDVAAALEYQRAHGGYFGEALLALERVTPEELEWGLASQFDLPYVFPDADAIDPEAAALVTAHWALRHLALPIMRTEETLTVVVDSPTRTEAIRELQMSSGMEVELALAPAARIRELIRKVFGEGGSAEPARSEDLPVSLEEFLTAAADEGASSFGVSIRDARVVGWYRREDEVRKHVLGGGWRGELETFLIPSPSSAIDGGERASWRGYLEWQDRREAVDVRFMAGGSGMEFVFRPVSARPSSEGRISAPPPGVVSEVSLLVKARAARFIVSTEPPSLASELLPRLPGLVLEPLTRSIHLSHALPNDPPAFAVDVPRDPDERGRILRELYPYQFDAVTAQLAAPAEQWIEQVLQLSPAAFVAVEGGAAISGEIARTTGLEWELSVRDLGEGALEWSIRPVIG